MTIIHCASTCLVCVSFMPATEEAEECTIVRGYREQLLLREVQYLYLKIHDLSD